MSSERVIMQADISGIEKYLNMVFREIESVDGGVQNVNENVKIIYDEIGKLANEFREYARISESRHYLTTAETRLIKIRQELENKYGHYDEVRRTTIGILQADDLGIVRKETITSTTEELMISAPKYWLAPCLVALAAWINNQPELADKALREGIKRNDEKTSLLFALICRRANRKQASLKWIKRYLENQDEEKLDKKTVVILDAFASGLLGADSEGLVSRQMNEWIDHLSKKDGFIEQQTTQWSEAINLKRKKIPETEYSYLRKYSKTWPSLSYILEGAHLHATMLTYFQEIFDKYESTNEIKAQLDEILTSLVTDFDEEEIPLRKDEKLNQFIVDFDGDRQRAKSNMKIEETAFEEYKDFTQLLTDAAMKPETSYASVSTQKLAIALSRDWIYNAYNDVVAQNRMKIPNEIEINVDTFNDKTTDGQNEKELLEKFNALIDSEKRTALSQVVLTGFEQFCLWGGAGIAIIGLIMIFARQGLLGIIAIIAGLGMLINHFSKKKNNEKNRAHLENKFDNKCQEGQAILRAILAEVVDFRREFEKKDKESKMITDFLEQIKPEQYVKRLADSTRRIKFTE